MDYLLLPETQWQRSEGTYSCTGCLVNRVTFKFDKVDIVAINDPLLTSTKHSTCSKMTLPTFTAQSRLRLGKLVINGKAISIF